MLYMVLVTVLLVVDSGVESVSCPSCENTFNTAKNINDAPGSCMAWKAYLTCLETATENCPQGSGQVEEIGKFYGYISHNCTLTDACLCQKGYWETHLTNTGNANCIAAKTRISCLRGNRGLGCDNTTTVAGLGAATETFIGSFGACSIEAGSGCECELNYVKADVSSDSKLCTETKQFISCVAGRPGTVCMATVAEAVVDAETTIINIPGNICDVSESACSCEIAYAKANVSDNNMMCTGAAGPGCNGSAIVQLIAAAEATLTSVNDSACLVKDTTCGCEVTYATTDVSTPAKLCNATETYISCLAGKSQTGCDGKTSVVQLAASAEAAASSAGSCSFTAGTVCGCELNYTKADISTSSLKCKALQDFLSCLVGKSGTGCDGSTALRTLASNIDASLIALGQTECPRKSNCACEAAFTMADISNNNMKCTETKKLTTCILSSVTSGCGSASTKTSIGKIVQSTLTDIGPTVCPITSTCQCEVNFNKADISDSSSTCKSATTSPFTHDGGGNLNVYIYNAFWFKTPLGGQRETDELPSLASLLGCLGAVTETTDPVCDGSKLTEDLITASKSLHSAFCSSGEATGISILSCLLLTMASKLVAAR